MNVADLLPAVHLPDLIATHWGYEAVRSLDHDQGGLICDRRPGHQERHASFSIFMSSGVWHYKRHGGDEASGNAYGFLLEIGYSKRHAWEELHRLADVPLDACQIKPFTIRPTSSPLPLSALERARSALTRCAPLSADELARVACLLSPLASQDQAAQDLRARGLLGWEGLQVGTLRRTFQTREGKVLARAGALGVLLTGPDGNTWGLKVRNLGSADELAVAGVDRYVYRLARHGAPAWCSPTYGQGGALLITEGELNGAAASRALSDCGLALDVQGLAGAGGVPHLEGIAGRVVYLYADPDPAGAACVQRVGRIAQAAGAVEVRVVASLTAGDFCEELGRLGAAVFGEQLQERLNTAELWQSDICGKSGLPQIKAAPSEGKTELWQCGTTSQSWIATDGGWGSNRGGW